MRVGFVFLDRALNGGPWLCFLPSFFPLKKSPTSLESIKRQRLIQLVSRRWMNSVVFYVFLLFVYPKTVPSEPRRHSLFVLSADVSAWFGSGRSKLSANWTVFWFLLGSLIELTFALRGFLVVIWLINQRLGVFLHPETKGLSVCLSSSKTALCVI